MKAEGFTSFCRWEIICQREALENAWMQIWAGRTGAARLRGAGVDGVTLADWHADGSVRLQALALALRQGRYHPSPLLWVEVAKDGEERARCLGIPTVTDRIVQRVAKNALEPIWERIFLSCSHGFRPGRSTLTASAQVLWYQVHGFSWVLKSDIRACFDSIPHEPVLTSLEDVADVRVVELVANWLAVGASKRHQGLAQGAVISPLLANIYLHAFDVEMVYEHWAMVRYADDLVVMCRNLPHALQALMQVRASLGRLGLSLSEEKTVIVPFGPDLHFLGGEYSLD